eukprot:TRINITY_DN22163_c1_g1_i1.p1 TRINITY_DN22163_c1_g1~~TRINITY_DN22163_c1_g1_i1.p1  ORF type:complete len:716 (+),score=162.82 TRINITY_DN22163_c1_g1_i1:57-2150(+)
MAKSAAASAPEQRNDAMATTQTLLPSAATAAAAVCGVALLQRPSHKLPVAWTAAVILLLRHVARVRRLAVRTGIAVMRLVLPLSFGVVSWRMLRTARAVLHPTQGHTRLKELAKSCLTVWAVAEVSFYFYIVQCHRVLSRPSTKRWRAVNLHSSAERRRESMERYLDMITQICLGGDQGEGAEMAARDAAASSGTPSATADRRSRASGAAVEGSPNTLRTMSQPKPVGLGGLKRSTSGKGSNGDFGLRRAHSNWDRTESVDDLLRLWDDGPERRSSGDAFPADVLQRLKYIEICGWFTGSGCGDMEAPREWLRRGNVEDWVAYYWFRGLDCTDLEPRERVELQKLTDLALSHMGLEDLHVGRTPNVEPVRLQSDPLIYLHRPLALYLGNAVGVPLLTKIVMLRLGFVRENIGGLCYWHRRPRNGVKPEKDLAGPGKVPVVLIHGLGVGLLPYFTFILKLSQNHSDNLYVPELPFLASRPYETVPSAREVVAQLQDMLTVNGHTAAHFVGHSFGCIVLGWMLKRSPSSVLYVTLLEPALFLIMKSDILTKVLYGSPGTCLELLYRYFVFRELFTVNLLCRNFFWEQNTMWPEELRVPAVIQLAGDDALVHSRSVRRLMEYEQANRAKAARNLKLKTRNASGSSVDIRKDSLQRRPGDGRTLTCPLEIHWCEGFFHGMILGHTKETDNLFAKMRKIVQQ